MDEFKSEDELRPDSSDRRPPRQRKGPSVPKIAMSRQHLMIGIGILILLLVVIGVGSALKSPSSSDADRPSQSASEKNIDLSGSTAPAGNGATSPANTAAGQTTANTANPATTNGAANNTANGSNAAAPAQPETLSVPPVASTPSMAPPSAAPAPQHRIDLPGNMADALSQQGDQVNGMTEQMNNEGTASTLPTAPALVAPSAKELKESAHKAGVARTPAAAHKTLNQSEAVPSVHTAPAAKPAAKVSAAGSRAVAPAPMATVSQHAAPAPSASQHITPATPAISTASRHAAAPTASGPIQSAPAGFYTLQLSSASQAATLNAYAQKQQLSQYWVYETRREGKPWFVLVSGVYPTSTQAKSAVAQLPVDIQANKPWARQIGQVKQDQNK